jgi:hypothetical protein
MDIGITIFEVLLAGNFSILFTTGEQVGLVPEWQQASYHEV